MRILETREELKEYCSSISDISLGFVPSLGGLHAGHVSLIERSLKENEATIVSLFLNPTQFNDKSDLEKYPKNDTEDLQVLKDLSVDTVFLPTSQTMYPHGEVLSIIENSFSKILCGAKRPGHFEGVLTIVLKLLNLMKPDKIYMGEKDYQQASLIKAMIDDLFIDTEIVFCPTVRESSGLALSSRNKRLSPEGRARASKLYEIITQEISLESMDSELSKEGFEVDYLEMWNKRLFVAAYLEGVRLIDNVMK